MINPLPSRPLRVSLRKVRGRKVVNNKEYTYEYYVGVMYVPKHVGEYIEQSNVEVRGVLVPAEVADRVAEEARRVVDFKEAVKDWVSNYLRSRG